MAHGRWLALVLLLGFALLLPIGACAWNQTLYVNVSDQNGMPVSGAAITVIYQKANGITGSDGLEEGYTGDSGIYAVNLTNSVPEGLEMRKISVNASAAHWTGEEKEVDAGAGGGPIEVVFVANISLEKITIVVLQPDGSAAPGASIYITGSPIKRIADSQGRADVHVAKGIGITGFASYRSDGDYFSSSSAATGENGTKEIVVRLPSPGREAAANKTTVSIKFITPANEPVSGERVVFSQEGTELPTYTNALGIATLSFSRSGEVNATLNKNDYNYTFSFNITADGNTVEKTVALPELLKIEYFESKPDGQGCHLLSAKVSDPRTSRPISIRITPVINGTEMTDLPIMLDEGGLYSAKVCGGENVLVKATAFNSYEKVEKTISLAYVPPPPPPAAPQRPNETGNGTVPLKPAVQPSPDEGVGAMVAGAALLVVVLAAAAIVLGKKGSGQQGGPLKYFSHLWEALAGSAVRPIIEYLHSIFKKKEPPQRGSAFYQPPE